MDQALRGPGLKPLIGPAFDEYRRLTKNKTFSHRAAADQLAKCNILSLGDKPITHQNAAFQGYADIRKVILKDTYLNNAYYDSESRVDAAKAMVAESRTKGTQLRYLAVGKQRSNPQVAK
ncbi:hypothetical protein KI688_003325 [Linnemannia hyalina]|uniref:Uncharacterized protein n=1 Tax=Linnemannia hyalina TaxID=64524 RepID=A0A9P7XQI4_9FUNG|nr:hypothetical protein KI688_003325 [Linnemannia hyalina]